MPILVKNLYEPQYPQIVLQTRAGHGSEIRNVQVNIPLSASDLHYADVYKRQFNFATYRSGPCGFYNCHGLTFASRRTRIFESEDIWRILKEDNYKTVLEQDVLPGDIVIYYRKGDPQHSGIVVAIPHIQDPLSQFRILSKWGHSHEVVHALRDCPYSSSCDSIIFYRVHSVHHGDRS